MDVERTMQFILDNLASVAAKQEKAETEIQALRKLVTTGMKMLVGIQQEHKNLDAKMAALMDAQLRTDQKMAELAESQKRTDEKFRQWLDTRNGSNGQGKKPK